MAELERAAFTPQVEAQAPQSYDDVSECEALQYLDFTGKDDTAKAPQHEEVHDFQDQCFLLRGLLSDSENQFFIDSGENIGFGPIHLMKTSVRNCERIMVKSQSLAEALWSRVQPFLRDIVIEGDPKPYHIHGVKTVLQGTWRPHSINEIFRLCKYLPGGHFAPHFDGYLVKSPTLRSMKTLMLYLNGDFEGGTTNFVDEAQQLYQNESGRYCAEEENIICRIKPEAGLAIVFNHHRLHEGQAIQNNKKYILRTDILYERVDGPQVSEADTQALLMLQEAERLECRGDAMEAMELYRKAFKLSPSLEESFNS